MDIINKLSQVADKLKASASAGKTLVSQRFALFTALQKSFGSSFVAALFAPAFFFLFLALAVVFAPKLLLFVFSSILIFIALFLGIVAWKFITLKNKLDKVRNDFRAKVFVERVDPFGSDFADVEQFFDQTKLMTEDEEGDVIEIVEGKKIIFH